MVSDALTVVIIHHRTPAALARALEALASSVPECPLWVVDTAFDAGCAAALQTRHPTLRWLPAANHSYAHAVNCGIKRATTPWVAIMNADVVVTRETFAALLAPFRDPRVAFSGPLARSPSGERQGLGLWQIPARARLRYRPAGAWLPVPWLAGYLLLARREALADIGGMDPRFRFYNEDAEWGLRARRRGWRNALVATEVVHEGGAATPSHGTFLLEGLRGGLLLTRRYAPRGVRLLHRLAVALAAGFAASRATDPDQRRAWQQVAQAFHTGDLDRSPFGESLAVTVEPSERW